MYMFKNEWITGVWIFFAETIFWHSFELRSMLILSRSRISRTGNLPIIDFYSLSAQSHCPALFISRIELDKIFYYVTIRWWEFILIFSEVSFDSNSYSRFPMHFHIWQIVKIFSFTSRKHKPKIAIKITGRALVT